MAQTAIDGRHRRATTRGKIRTAASSDKVFTEGLSGIFAQNEHETPVGFYDTWDDVSSVSDGPTAVLLSPGE